MGDAFGDVLSPLFSLPLVACTGLGEFPAEAEPTLLELEFEEVDEGLFERPP